MQSITEEYLTEKTFEELKQHKHKTLYKKLMGKDF